MRTLRTLSVMLIRFHFPALVFVLAAAVAVLYLNSRAEQQRRQEAETVSQVLESARTEFQKNLNSVMYLATGVVAYIQANNGFIPTDQAISWLRSLQDYNPYIRNIGIAPGNRIQFIYPIEGNEKALGVYYPDLADQWPRVKLAIDQRRPVIDGPVQLIQGGLGLVHRAPVFLQDGRYWGMISTVMRLDNIMADVRDEAAREGVELRFLLHENDVLPDDNGTQHVIAVPVEDLKWRLAGRKLEQRDDGFGYHVVLVWLIVLLMTLVAYKLSASTWRQRLLQTSLNESLKLFQVAFQRVPHGLLVLDKEQRIVEANPVMLRLLGRSADALRDTTLAAVIAAEQRQHVSGLLAGSLAGASATLESELLGQPLSEAIPVEISIVGLQHEQLGWLVFMRDIRDSRRLQQAQNEFISTASHELRTPLTSIIGVLELIKSEALGKLPADVMPMLDMAVANSDRLQKLINDLLDTNRLILGKMHLVMQPVDAVEVARSVILSLQPLAAQRNIRLQLVAPDVPMVMADADKLAQVLVNLVANAIRFSFEDHEVVVRIAHARRRVRFSVQDFGRGIDPAFAARAFTRFGQADSSDTREQSGTGLGLFICKGLVEHMQGQIDYESNTDEGVTFWFELPAATD